jgi:hypothetical protein
VRVVLRNNVRERRVWVDSDVNSLVDATVIRALNDEERRVVNFTAEYGEISVGEAESLTQRSWASAKLVLQKLAVKGIFEYQSRSGIARDPLTRFYLRRKRRPREGAQQ